MRLIDADMLKEKFADMVETPTDRLICLIAKQVVDSQPTAYYVDKVIEELESKQVFCDEFEELPILEAIEIVKRGGVNVPDTDVGERRTK